MLSISHRMFVTNCNWFRCRDYNLLLHCSAHRTWRLMWWLCKAAISHCWPIMDYKLIIDYSLIFVLIAT